MRAVIITEQLTHELLEMCQRLSELEMVETRSKRKEELRKLRHQLEGLAAELQEHFREEGWLREEMEQQNKAKTRFISTLAHELRTPLTPVLGSARLLIEQFRPEPGSPQDKLITSIVRGAESLESRLSDLLNLAQLEAGAFSLEIAPVDPKELLNDLALQFQPLAESKGQSFALDLPQKLHLVKADRRRIGQVLMNLLNNALKFTPEHGSIVLRAMVRDRDLVIEVQNSGQGLSSEELQRLFQPYYRTEVDRQRFHGSGLGLALCKQLVEAHGGKMWLESEPDKGITFGFNLPLERSAIRDGG